jgi:C4-type Zn-finger protein
VGQFDIERFNWPTLKRANFILIKKGVKMKEIIAFVETEKECPNCKNKMMQKMIISICDYCNEVKDFKITNEYKCMKCNHELTEIKFIERPEPNWGC